MQWAFRECLDHYAFQLKHGQTTCMDCGHTWTTEEDADKCVCPKCKAKLEVQRAKRQKAMSSTYFSVLTERKGLQLMRAYQMKAYYRKGTFYYHFKDIYDLVDWIMVEDAAKALEGRQSFENWTDAFLDILHQVQDNKVLVMNVYRSVSREQLEQYLYKLLDSMLRDFVDRSAQGFTVQDSDKQFIIDFYKYALVGMALEWIRKDMKEDPVRMTERLNVLLHGELERALRRFRTDRSPADLDD